jgi:hypothetical protein
MAAACSEAMSRAGKWCAREAASGMVSVLAVASAMSIKQGVGAQKACVLV